MVHNQEHIDRYLKVMRFAYSLWTAIWLGLIAAILIFAADWGSALALCGIFTALYIWVFVLWRRNVKQAAEKFRNNS